MPHLFVVLTAFLSDFWYDFPHYCINASSLYVSVTVRGTCQIDKEAFDTTTASDSSLAQASQLAHKMTHESLFKIDNKGAPSV